MVHHMVIDIQMRFCRGVKCPAKDDNHTISSLKIILIVPYIRDDEKK
jgi:hypothetical protein